LATLAPVSANADAALKAMPPMTAGPARPTAGVSRLACSLKVSAGGTPSVNGKPRFQRVSTGLPGRPERGPPRVVVVEDQTMLADLVATGLRRESMAVDVAYERWRG
jgi:hypothetical protein